MSRIEELIEKLCPDGVEFKKLCEVTKINQYKQLGASELELLREKGGDVRLLPSSRNFDWTTSKERAGGFLCNGEVFVLGRARKANMKYVNGYFISSNNIIIESFNVSKLLTKFIYYFVSNNTSEIYVETSTYPKFDFETFNNLLIPVPPMEIQEEIVKILDNFTELTVELTVELTAELTARKQQYEYYLKILLTEGEMQTIKLSKVGKVCMCKRIMKDQTASVGDVPFYKIGTFGGVADAFISQELFEEYKSKYSYPKKNDILISCSGTIGRTVKFDGNPAYFQDSNIVWLNNDEQIVLNDYLYYCYKLMPFKISTGGTIARLYNSGIEEAEIKIPSLKKQREIVDTLEKFEKIAYDLVDGLPAEIEARQKQYEYYRDKLLTFKEKKA